MDQINLLNAIKKFARVAVERCVSFSLPREMKPFVLIAILACPAALFAGDATLLPVARHVSSLAGARLMSDPPLAFTETDPAAPPDFSVDESRVYQTIAGFGASFMEAGMICLNSLPETKREEVLRALFDPLHGAGFTLMKTPLAGTDFMSAGPWFSYNDRAGDSAMKNFSIARDLGPDGVATYIQHARRHGRFTLQATMDYPPDWMLVDVNQNQDLNPEWFDALARYYLCYLREYEKQGIAIDYLSPFNEPGVYTKIPWWKIRDLIKNHVGPLLAKEEITTRLMLPESSDRRNAWDNQPVVMEDPAARRFIAVMPYHGYNGGGFGQVAALGARYPDIPLWMTEVCHGYIVRTPREFPLPHYDFEDSDHWGNMIFSDLEAGAAAWVYWNMILDEKGGPWLTSPIHGNPKENIQHPLVIINRETGKVTYTGAYWVLAHFSKFVRPGAKRIASSGSHEGVRCLVFKNPEGGFVAQFLNSRKEDTRITLGCRGQSVSLALAAVSITTCLW